MSIVSDNAFGHVLEAAHEDHVVVTVTTTDHTTFNAIVHDLGRPNVWFVCTDGHDEFVPWGHFESVARQNFEHLCTIGRTS